MKTRRDFLRTAAAGAMLPALPRIACAQAYPSRSVRIIVGVSAGGTTDISARVVAQWLTTRMGQPFVVENRPGGATSRRKPWCARRPTVTPCFGRTPRML